LRVVYDQTLQYDAAANHNGLNATPTTTPEELVVLPFESPEWNAAYIILLNSDSHSSPNLLTLGGPVNVPLVLGTPVQTSFSRTLTNGVITLLVVLCFAVVMYGGYRLLLENRGGLKVPENFAPDTFSFIGSETSKRFGE
jgi:hypothetical protein